MYIQGQSSLINESLILITLNLYNLCLWNVQIFEDIVGIMDPEMNIVEENEEDLADVIESKEQETEPASAETVQSDKPETYESFILNL